MKKSKQRAAQRARAKASGVTRTQVEVETPYKALLDRVSLLLERPLSEVVSDLIHAFPTIPAMRWIVMQREVVGLDLALGAEELRYLQGGLRCKPALSEGGVIEHLLTRRMDLVSVVHDPAYDPRDATDYAGLIEVPSGTPGAHLHLYYRHPGVDLRIPSGLVPEDRSKCSLEVALWDKYSWRRHIRDCFARGEIPMDPDVAATLGRNERMNANDKTPPPNAPWYDDSERVVGRSSARTATHLNLIRAQRERMRVEEGGADEDDEEAGLR